MDTQKHIKLLEKELGFEPVSGQDLLDIQKINSNTNYQKDKEFFIEFLDATEIQGDNEIISKMQGWETDLWKKANPSINEVIDPYEENRTFKYLVCQSERNASFLLNSPQNGFTWNDSEQVFCFSNAFKQTVNYSILDNLSNVKESGTIESNSQNLTIKLNTKLNNGLYYILFNSGNHQLIFHFFI